MPASVYVSFDAPEGVPATTRKTISPNPFICNGKLTTTQQANTKEK